MKLDGKPIRTVVDTGASQSILDLDAASYLFDAAQADLDHAIALAPRYADAYRLRSSVRRAKHDEDGAKADLDAATRYEPNSAATFEMRAEQRRQSHDANGALADAAHALHQLGRQDEALADYAQAIELAPMSPATATAVAGNWR